MLSYVGSEIKNLGFVELQLYSSYSCLRRSTKITFTKINQGSSNSWFNTIVHVIIFIIVVIGSR